MTILIIVNDLQKAIGDRKIRIQNGYGLEATITDAFSRRLIEEVIKPNFKQQAYYEGLDQATTFIIQKASGEFVNDDFGNGSGEDSFIPYLIIISFIILMFFLSSRGGKGGRGLHHGPSPFMGTFGSSGYSGGSSSSFGGFGGGSFGGGGAGGSW
jgi:uncharacterized protein